MSEQLITRAIVYSRKSTHLTNSIESQVDACLSLIKSEYGEVETLVFTDEGVSGSLGINEREGLSKVIENLNDETVVVAVDVSRLARSIYVQLEIERAISKAGARLHLADTGLFGITPENELQGHMLAAFAEYYRQATRHKIKTALQLKKKKGQVLGRPKAFCRFNQDHTGFEINKEGMEILKVANEARANGSTWQGVADKLNSLMMLNTRGGRWTTRSVRHTILTLREV